MNRRLIIVGVLLALMLSVPVAVQGFAGFTYNQLLDHFRYYHERSECIYQGDGTWGNIEYNIFHPQPRGSSRRVQGYMRAYTVDANPVYQNRALAGLEWLLQEQNSDGHFTWWNNPSGTNNIFDCQYETGEGAAALAEGYALYGDIRYLQASADAAAWGENLEFGWNTNYVLFNAWHQAKHYRITGDTRWLNAAVYKVQYCALARQDTDGGFLEGPGAPSDLIGHNKRIWYHAIILRGMIETYRVMPTNHPLRTQLYNGIVAAVNYAYNMQLPSGEIQVGAGVPNEHRNAFILEALLMAHQYCGIDTSDRVRGIMQYRLDLSQGPYQMPDYTIDVQSVGLLMQRYSTVVPNPPSEPTPPPLPPSPVVTNGNFEGDGGFFELAGGWQSYGFGKREGFQETGHGWVQGLCDYPEGKTMGIYQIIAGAAVGSSYRLSADIRAGSTQLAGSIGAAGIKTHDVHAAVFSTENTTTSWQTKTVDFTATEPYVTIFLQGRNTSPYSISFDRVYVDNVTLTPISPVPPAIVLNPTSLSPSVVQGSNAAPQSFTIRNAGGGTLSYTISDNASWLSETPTNGSSTGETDTITVNYSTSGLSAGTYNATITVTASGASNSPQTIPVTLTVTSGGGQISMLNTNFEGGFYNDPDADHKSGTSWHRFSVAGSSKCGGWYGTYHSASWSQAIWESSWTAGFYQQATGATNGNKYTASIWVRGSNTSLKFWVGIDPTGGTSATSGNVQWSSECIPGTTWTQISKQLTAGSSTITVFIKAQNTAGSNNYAYFDDANLVDDGPGTPPTTGTIAGNVKDGAGANVSGATVSTTSGGYTTTTNSSGNYTLSSVAAGTYSVVASKTGYNSQTQTGKSVTAGQTTTCSFTITRQTGAIAGNVKDGSGVNVSGATVSTTTGGYTTTTNSSGNYTLSNVATGTYDVIASKSGYNSQTQTGKTVNNAATTTVNFTITAQGGIASEDFTTIPSWTSTYDAPWGSAATFTSVTGGQSGNCMQASRTSQGSSSKVKVYTVPQNTNITISCYMKCPSYANSYWMEFACRLGSYSAQNFDSDSANWTMIKKFSNSGTNGNGNTWTNYSTVINTGSNTQISIGYKHGASGNNGPTVGWDTFLIQ